jgi:hypothetical protein
METDDLIQRLAQNVVPARQFPAPMARVTLWLVVSLPYIVITVVGYQLAGFEVFLSPDARYLVQQLATLATTVTAGVAAFCSVVPGRDLRIVFVPLLPLFVWLGSVAGKGRDQAPNRCRGLGLACRLGLPSCLGPAWSGAGGCDT